MSKLIFITKNDSNEPTTRYFAIPADKIEKMSISDTYNEYGQKVGDYEAGNFISLTKDDADCLNVWCSANTELLEDEEGTEYTFTEGDIINADDFRYDLFEKVISQDSFIKTTCEGFNYHNGRNHQTICIEMEHFEPNYSLVEDAALIKRLRTAIARKKYIGEGHGNRGYRYGKVTIEESFWQGNFAEYILEIED